MFEKETSLLDKVIICFWGRQSSHNNHNQDKETCYNKYNRVKQSDYIDYNKYNNTHASISPAPNAVLIKHKGKFAYKYSFGKTTIFQRVYCDDEEITPYRFVILNPTRIIKDTLIKEGAYNPDKDKVLYEDGDNFFNPEACLIRPEEVKRMQIETLYRTIYRSLSAYQYYLEKRGLKELSLFAHFSHLEIYWDIPFSQCPRKKDIWLAFPHSKATKPERTIKATVRKGVAIKYYKKSGDTGRFEGRFNKFGIKTTVGNYNILNMEGVNKTLNSASDYLSEIFLSIFERASAEAGKPLDLKSIIGLITPQDKLGPKLYGFHAQLCSQGYVHVPQNSPLVNVRDKFLGARLIKRSIEAGYYEPTKEYIVAIKALERGNKFICQRITG